MIELELELDDRSLVVSTTPLLAAAILYFQDQETWSLAELSKKLNTPPEILARKLVFWINQGVLKEVEQGLYRVLNQAEYTSQPIEEYEEEEEEGSKEDSAEKQAMWSMVENFVLHMCRNLGGLGTERIQGMLTQLVPNYNESFHSLETHLEKMVDDDKLECSSDG